MNSFKNNFEQPITEKHPLLKKLGFYSINIAVICYIIIAFTSLVSCSSDDSPAPEEVVEVPPTLSLESGSEDTTYAIIGSPENGTLQHSIKALAPDGFKSLVINKVIDGTVSEYETIDKDHVDFVEGKTNYNYSLNYPLKENDLGHKISFKAVIIDANNNMATLDFADVRTEMKMVKATITLETRVPHDGSVIRPFYFYINENSINAINRNGIKDSGEAMVGVFSKTKDDGYYLASPNIVFPNEMVEGLNHKNTTKFKAANDTPYELALDSEFGVFDAHTIKNKFDELSYNTHEQKAQQVDTLGSRFFFKTDDGRTGVLQVVAYEILGEYSFLQIEILVTGVPVI